MVKFRLQGTIVIGVIVDTLSCVKFVRIICIIVNDMAVAFVK